MYKSKIKYVCSNCGYESLKWLGKCPVCNQWNTITEELVEQKRGTRRKQINIKVPITKLSDEFQNGEERIKTGITEFDRVLGGGLMSGSVILIGGDPGIGKSTLVLQAVSKIEGTVLYVSGEESVTQINLRAKRLNIKSDNLFLLAETDMDIITAAIEQSSPKVVVIDSIQTIYTPEYENAPGTVTQIRETTANLMQFAKKRGFSIIIVGHVTKEGYIAGPKVLEHIVDTVLQFEGEKNHSYRILRAQKNRFGSTNEIGIFEMHDTGLTEIKNPSEIFLSESGNELPGSAVTSSIEGTRPILLEVQALVTPTNFGNPQRVATGFDYRRLSILLAVLEKRAKLKLSTYNVFINIAGGIKIDEPAVDLAVCCAIASNLTNRSIKKNIVVIGEVGLGGEIRGVSFIDKRIKEAEKLGFKTIILPQNNIKSLRENYKTKIVPVNLISEALKYIFAER